MKESEQTVPRLWTCAVEGCGRASAIDIGDCERCRYHFCALHARSSTHHGCDTSPLDDASWTANRDEELGSLRASICDAVILEQVSQLNNGKACEFDIVDSPPGVSMMGGMHVHYPIRFADGSRWLLRVLRHNWLSFSDDLTNSIFVSECATLRWLERVPDVPSPRLHAYGLRTDATNKAGVTYMLIDELQGRPMLYLDPSPEQFAKVSRDLARVLSALSQHPLDRIGAPEFVPHTNGQRVHIGPIVGDRTGIPSLRGHFSSAKEYYVALCEQYLTLIADRQVFTSSSVDAYVMLSFLQYKAKEGAWSEFGATHDESPFFLKHMDDKGDHIFVDDDFHVTGIIDWTFARAVPIFEAFGPSLVTADMSDMYSGITRQTGNDKLLSLAIKAEDARLARFATASDRIRRLCFWLATGVEANPDEVKKMFDGAINAFFPESLADYGTWRQSLTGEVNGDKRFQALLEDVQHHPSPELSS